MKTVRKIIKVIVLLDLLVLPTLTLIKAPERSSIEEQLETESEMVETETSAEKDKDISRAGELVATINAKIEPYIEVAAKNVAVPKPIYVPASNYRGSILAIGDSVMLGARTTMLNTIPGIAVDAEGSRGIEKAVPIINANRVRGYNYNTYVIGLVTNYRAITTNTLQGIVNAGGADKNYIFITGYCGNSTCGNPLTNRASQNNAIYNFAASHSNVYVADWWGYVKDNPDAYFYADHTHLAPYGRTAYAALVKGVLNRL